MGHRLRVLLVILATIVAMGGQLGIGSASAAPIDPKDQTKVPHYFGPYPNWANSPLTLPDVTVNITGDGTGATATAQVGANGAVTGLTVTDPGSGYTAATVDITGAGTGATADAVVTPSGAVTAVSVGTPGASYTKPAATINGDGTGAAATAYGGVDAVTVAVGGDGYTFPTVDFDLPDLAGGVQAKAHAVLDGGTTGGPGVITDIVVDEPGSGYSAAPNVVIRDGTQFDPVTHSGAVATATATLKVTSVSVDAGGTGYTTATVDITDTTGIGSGATATAKIEAGTISALNLTAGGTGYLTGGGIKKFQDTLPGLTEANKNNLGQYLPIAQPDTTTFPGTDYYVIAVVQHREQMSSALPPTLLREYVQLSTSVVPGKQVALNTDLKAGGTTPTLMPDGVTPAVGVDDPHYLGPVIVAQKDRAVRITFYNLLPTGSEGDLFLPTDSTVMGSGPGATAMGTPTNDGTVLDGVRNPMCTEYPKAADCYKDNRATLHLHGGVTPWISDGTPHQWITPANESTPYPQGVSVAEVPDMVGANRPAGVADCSSPSDGCSSFYYTNQQSARLMFYHDHSYGITRLNVYAGEAAGYVIQDGTENALFGQSGPYADLGVGTPLIIQDRTFVPDAAQLAKQDPTWDPARWGTQGNLWYHHVYMPAQNPGDPSGMSSFGRWMYGPWFWPPATPPNGPIDNPYYDANCQLDVPSTWQYQTDPFCEPKQIPGTPNISAGMEQFNDTPIVNGTAYPTTSVDPKAYRFRILNAANDRFWNLQWYVADPSTGTDSEVALKPSEVAAAQTDPNVFPTPDTTLSPAGPDWIQIGTEGGFLPAPTVVKNQPITWITDPTRFDVGNVDQHSMLLAPAERADTIVDFSKYAGKTLILYNDAPAAFPARVACYDYYTGDPDLSPACAPSTLPGYGPNTRTIMQVKVNATAPAAAFDLAGLQARFRHHADGSGVFEKSQHPVIVGQASYNSAYGSTFASAGYCSSPTSTIKCDGYARINQQGGDPFTFDTLRGAKLSIPLQPKALHDEMNSAAFDEYGRMTANIGVEAVPATPALQNVTLYPYINPQTEFIDGTNLPTGDVTVTPIASATDGTQIWKITHNGVDTHPIHFHLYDVQLLNRVTWDNIIIPPDASELGWKDTVRISPLEDTIVALRPIVPKLPFEVPNSIRTLNPTMPEGSTIGFNSIDPNGNPTNPITNQLVNFGWEYVYHCHILSHEEMDMMRPVTLVLPPNKPDGLTVSVVSVAKNGKTGTVQISWNDNSINETSYVVQRLNGTGVWTTLGSVASPLNAANTKGGVKSFNDTTWTPTGAYSYRVVAQNTAGYPGGQFPQMTASAVSAAVAGPIGAPSGLTATLLAGPQVRLAWTDNALNESGFAVERSANGGAFAQIATAPARTSTGGVTFVDTTVALGNDYQYRVAALNTAGQSGYSNIASIAVKVPAAPTGVSGTAARQGSGERVTLTWTASAGASGYIVQWSSNNFVSVAGTATLGNVTTYASGTLARQVWYFRVTATNVVGQSPPSGVATVAAAP